MSRWDEGWSARLGRAAAVLLALASGGCASAPATVRSASGELPALRMVDGCPVAVETLPEMAQLEPPATFSDSYPFRLRHLSPQQVETRKAALEAANPGWQLTVGLSGRIVSAATMAIPCEDYRALSGGSTPSWAPAKAWPHRRRTHSEPAPYLPSSYRAVIDAFVARNWRHLGLSAPPAKGQPAPYGVHLRLHGRHKYNDFAPHWVMRFVVDHSIDKLQPPAATPTEAARQANANIRVASYLESCPPCQPRGNCTCSTIDLLKEPLDPAKVTAQAPSLHLLRAENETVARWLSPVSVDTEAFMQRSEDKARAFNMGIGPDLHIDGWIGLVDARTREPIGSVNGRHWSKHRRFGPRGVFLSVGE